jgi:DNA-binding CsgD family transcriptional regulator
MVIRPILCRRFIGREAELAYVHERRREAGSRRGGFVLIAGEAGVGKSRLLAEFAASLAKTRWRVGIGRCLEFAQSPYGPILEALARFDPAAAELSSAVSKREQFEHLAAAFERAAARGAIVIAIEDLHWADAASMQFLAYLAGRVARSRILVVASLRPDHVGAEHPGHAALGRIVSAPCCGMVDLRPLGGAHLRAFIDEALGDVQLSETTRRAVARTSDGNPFFVEELLKNAVEHGDDARNAAQLPLSVRAALLERVRPLSDDDRTVLAYAAVIGRRFDLDLLARTLARRAEELVPALLRARGTQLIVEDAPGRFRFRHALTHQAMYGAFLGSQLQDLHRAIALALERSSPDDASLELLAYHWWAAGDAERTARYNEAAADAAARVHAHEDAIVLYERALHAAPARSAARGHIGNKLAALHAVLSSHADAVDAYIAAARVFTAAGDARAAASSLVNAALERHAVGAVDLEPLERFLATTAADEYVARAVAHLGIAQVSLYGYRPAAAEAHLSAVDERARREAVDVELRYRLVAAFAAMIAGDAGAYHDRHAAWLHAARATGDMRAIADALNNGALFFTMLGRFGDAERNLDAARQLARSGKNTLLEAGALAVRAYLSVLRGDLHAARDAVDAVRAMSTDHRVMLAHAAAWGALAGAYLDDDALVAHWFDGMRAEMTPMWKPLYGAAYAELLVRRGRAGEARALLHEAVRLGERPRGIVFTLLAAARYADDADVEHARAALAGAGDAPAEVVESHALALFDAYVHQRRGRAAEAARSAASAVPGLRRLGVRLLEAAALELAGDRDAALALYRACGALHEVRRLEPAAARAGPLTAREREVAALVARGLSNANIARELGIAPKTVERHLGAAYQKLGYSSRARLAARFAPPHEA